MISFPYVISLASVVLVDAAGYAFRDPQLPSCQGFDVFSNETQSFPSQDLIISTGVVCNDGKTNISTPCEVLSGSFPYVGHVTNYVNGTEIHDDYAIAYGIWNATGDRSLNAGPRIYAIENQTVTFENGTSGYVIFTPTYRCINGRVQGCSSNASVADGTEVNACYPELTDRVVPFETVPGNFENITVLAGTRSINETSSEVAAKLKQIPNSNPPFGLVSSGADAAMELAGVGLTSVWVIATLWLGL